MPDAQPRQSEVEVPNDGRGARCGCGHYKSEHGASSCRGAYATLMADADDFESVEVGCPCVSFYERDPSFPHLVR